MKSVWESGSKNNSVSNGGLRQKACIPGYSGSARDLFFQVVGITMENSNIVNKITLETEHSIKSEVATSNDQKSVLIAPKAHIQTTSILARAGNAA